jgi:hypothetical protein
MRCRRRLAGQLLASERDESGPGCVGEITEVADADEASGQHMLAEAAQELDATDKWSSTSRVEDNACFSYG